MSIQPEELVKGIGKLASLPEVCIRLNEMVEDPRYSAMEVGDVIGRDAALTAQLLRLVNSAFFNFPAKVSTITRAVMIIGERELRYLVLAMSAVKAFANVPVELVSMETFWRHCVYCGVVAKLIAVRCNVLHSERLFVAGLLHDIGLLVTLNRVPELERVALHRAASMEEPVFMAEQEVFGQSCDHAAVGGALLKSWNLPPDLCDTVAYHHNVAGAGDAMLDAAIVHIANLVANRSESATVGAFEVTSGDPLAWELTGLSEDIIPALQEEAGPMFAESWALIQPMFNRA